MTTTGTLEARFGSGPRWQTVRNSHILGVGVATILLLVTCALFVPNFTKPDNLLGVAQQISIVAIVAVGMTYIIIGGEIDLSIGSQYGFFAVLFAWLFTKYGMGIPASLMIVFFAAIFVGLVNGVFATRFKIPSFIVTLATLSILRGAALLIAGGVPIVGPSDTTFNSILAGNVAGNLTAQVVWMVAVAAVGGLVLAKSRFGWNVYSVGGNARAAEYAGINVRRVKITTFVIGSVCAALGGAILVAWLGSASPLTGTGFELSVIAAVVVGGASLTGGRGNILGTVLGAVIAGVISNALVLVGVDGNWQQVATGSLILVAVLLNITINRKVGSRAD